MKTNIKAMKLACKAFYHRSGSSGLNTYDSEAFAECKDAIKAETGELYASGQWYKNQYELGENV